MITHYLVLAVKVLLRRKFFTFISLFGISLTMLVLLTVTAILDRTLAAAPPESNQARMLTGTHAELWGPANMACCSPSADLFDRHARDLPGAELLSLYSNNRTVVSYVDGKRIEASLKRTDGDVILYSIGFVKEQMVIFTTSGGLGSVTTLPKLRELAGISSSRLDASLAQP